MATHREMCKSLFRERVLPKFPQAKERFSRYFDDSCRLIPIMPPSTERDLLIHHPEYRKGRCSAAYQVESHDMDIALTAFGLKPLSLSSWFSTDTLRSCISNPRWLDAFHQVGLEILPGKNTIYVYDPVLVAPILSGLLNRDIEPHQVRDGLKEYRKSYGEIFSNELLGYPQMLEKGKTRGHLFVKSDGFMPFPTIYRMSRFSFGLHTPEAVLNDREAWASAAAIIEEIRESPLSITSMAVLEYNGDGFLHKDAVLIERTRVAGEWKISQDNESRRIMPLARDLRLH
ncbi:hypothetical protein H0O02_01990 [Candidatus Micrarchaeota archaeon]|nr:hypothetical protein [Candidatus Micrarchaeota archaeon]